MAESLDLEALWPWPLGRYGTSKGNAPCLMEVVSLIGEGELDDNPDCTGEVLIDFLIEMNDAMPDVARQKLLRVVPGLIGSVDELAEGMRGGWMVATAFQVWLPMALEAGGLPDLANEVRLTALNCDAVASILLKVEKATLHVRIPMIGDCVEAAVIAWSYKDGVVGALGAANMASKVMALNDATARECCLPGGLKSKIGYAPGIYDSIVEAIEGALLLGKHGAALDPWEVMVAAQRFRELDKPHTQKYSRH